MTLRHVPNVGREPGSPALLKEGGGTMPDYTFRRETLQTVRRDYRNQCCGTRSQMSAFRGPDDRVRSVPSIAFNAAAIFFSPGTGSVG